MAEENTGADGTDGLSDRKLTGASGGIIFDTRWNPGFYTYVHSGCGGRIKENYTGLFLSSILECEKCGATGDTLSDFHYYIAELDKGPIA